MFDPTEVFGDGLNDYYQLFVNGELQFDRAEDIRKAYDTLLNSISKKLSKRGCLILISDYADEMIRARHYYLTFLADNAASTA